MGHHIWHLGTGHQAPDVPPGTRPASNALQDQCQGHNRRHRALRRSSSVIPALVQRAMNPWTASCEASLRCRASGG